MKKFVTVTLFLLLLTGLIFAGGRGDTYPTKDIQFVAPANAGGGTDAISRKICQLAEPHLGGKSFYVINRPGAADAVGPNVIMGAKPDGYTIGAITAGGVTSAVYQNLIPGYDLDKLEFIAMMTQENDAWLVGKNTPYRTFDDVIQAAKNNPGNIRMGGNEIGSRQDVNLRKVEQKFGIEFSKISYTSAAPQAEALLNGEVEVILNSLGDFSSIIKSGDGIPVVEFSGVRNPTFPTVPLSSEFGMGPEFISGSFLAVIAPKGIPEDVKQTLFNAFKKAAESQEFLDWCKDIGMTPSFMDSEETLKFVKTMQNNIFAGMDDLKRQGILK